jgi:hypothetical protein
VDEAIVKVDKAFRSRLFAIYAVCIVAIASSIVFGLRPFNAYLDGLNFPQLMNATEVMVAFGLAMMLGPSLYLIVVGKRIVRAQRMPYPSQKVIHDTKVILGSKAVLRGRLLLYLGILGIVVSLAGAGRSIYLVEKFRHFNPFEHLGKATRVVMNNTNR